MTSTALIAAIVVLMCTGSGNASRSMLTSSASTGPSSTSSALPLLQNVFTFWINNGPDQQYGGFHGTLDRQGKPISPTNKMIVQQARHLWAFSTLLKAGPESWGFKTQNVRAAADSLYAFMQDIMMKEVDRGKLFVYEATREGKVANASINMVGNAYAIYGLAAYAQATGSAEARSLALNTFKTLDRLFHDSANGGYDESTADFSLGAIPLGPSGTGSSSSSSVITEAGGSAASKKVKGRLSQNFGPMMHMTEALTELSKTLKGSDPTVTARLQELLQVLTGRMVIRPNTAGPNTPAAYFGSNYNPRSWSPVGSASTNYGANLEVAWLFAAGVDELQARGAVNNSKAAAMRSALREVAEAAILAGYDNKNGGLFGGSDIGAASPTSPNKVWWAHAEALLGLDWLHKQTGEATYKTKLQQTLKFVNDNLLDKQYGEWYWQTGPAGGAPLPYNAGDVDFAGTVKGNAWKASYHTGRALMRLVQGGY